MTTSGRFNAAVQELLDEGDDALSYHARRVAKYDCMRYRRDGDPPCRRMSCASCGRTILCAYQEDVYRAAKQSGVQMHLVLTAPPNADCSKATAKRMRRKLLRLRQSFLRKFKKPLRGVWVLGSDKGRLHFHVITNVEWTPWIKEKWISLTGAFEVHHRTIYDLSGMVGYLLKNYVAVTNRHIGRRIGGFGNTKLCVSRAQRTPEGFERAAHGFLFKEVRWRLDGALELPNRPGKLWPYPPFRSARRAARVMVREFGKFDHWLVMPWPSLAPLRTELLKQGKVVIVPSPDGTTAQRMTFGERGQVPLFSPYRGPVDIAVIACTAFSPDFPEPYAVDNERQASLLEAVQGPEVGLQRTLPALPVVCLASDAQEVATWPRSARGSIPVQAVITRSRVIPLDPELKRLVEQEEKERHDALLLEIP